MATVAVGVYFRRKTCAVLCESVSFFAVILSDEAVRWRTVEESKDPYTTKGLLYRDPSTPRRRTRKNSGSEKPSERSAPDDRTNNSAVQNFATALK